jgi:hypothetical protein
MNNGRCVSMFGSASAPVGHPVLAEAERLGRLLATVVQSVDEAVARLVSTLAPAP